MLRTLYAIYATFLLSVGMTSGAIISDSVWIDTNKNGIREVDEPSAPGVKIKLYYDHNNEGFAERLVDTQITDANGEFLFEGLATGKYQVAISLIDIPLNLYRVTDQHTTANPLDSDVNPNSLRTDLITIDQASARYENLADIGMHPGDGELIYRGPSRDDSNNHIWTYQDIFMGISLNGRTIDADLTAIIKQWMEWHTYSERIHQEFMMMDDYFFQRRRHYSEYNGSYRVHWITNSAGAYGGGADSSGGVSPDALFADPYNVSNFRLMFYEGSRGLSASTPFSNRACWTPRAIRHAHLLSFVLLHELGGYEAVDQPIYSFRPTSFLDSLDHWEKSTMSFVEHADRYIELDGGKPLPLTNGETAESFGGGPMMGIIIKAYLDFGYEKLFEIFINFREKPLMSPNGKQSAIAFQQAVNDATDHHYADDMVTKWKLPADTVYTHPSEDTGSFVQKDLYLWDCKPHYNTTVRKGYSLFSALANKGMLKWTSETKVIRPRFREYYAGYNDGVNSAFWQTHEPFLEVPFGKKVAFSHQLTPGLWKVKLEMAGFEYPDPVTVIAEGQTVLDKQPQTYDDIEKFNFEIEVTDGSLDIEIINTRFTFGLRGVIIEKVGRPLVPPESFSLKSHEDGATNTPIISMLEWEPSRHANTYTVSLKGVNTSQPYDISEKVFQNQWVLPRDLEYEKTYSWSVTAENFDGKQESSEWTFTTQPKLELPSIGINFGATAGTTEIANLTFDDVDRWTDATGTSGSNLVVQGNNGQITASWSASGVWRAGTSESTEEKLYYNYLDDIGDGATITLNGLSDWLDANNISKYWVRIYRNTDTTTFSDVEIFVDGSLQETLLFGADTFNPGVIGSSRAQGQSQKSYSSDSITITPTTTNGRGTIAGIAIIGAVADEDLDGLPDDWELQNFPQLATQSASTDHDGDGLIELYEYYLGTDPANPRDSFYTKIEIQNKNTYNLKVRSSENITFRVHKSRDLKSWETYDVKDTDGDLLGDFSIPITEEETFDRYFYRVEILSKDDQEITE